MPAIGDEDMGSAMRSNIDHVPAVDILVHFVGMFPVLEGFRRRAVLLLVSLLPMVRALSHAPNLPLAYCVHYSICARPLKRDTVAQALHWMEPASTLAEVARILRPGGVFAAYDQAVNGSLGTDCSRRGRSASHTKASLSRWPGKFIIWT